MAKTKNTIIDYNGYDYEEFWREHPERAYEDAADKLAVAKLIQPCEKFVDVGGAYGRLTPVYLGIVKKPTVFDYSKTELKQAKEKFGDKIETVAGNAYEMPFADSEFDGAVMVRVSHHFEDLEKVVKEFYRIIKPGGYVVMEIANKKTLPRMVRYWRGKTKVSPFDWSVENRDEVTKTVFYNYHPKYVEKMFKDAGFKIEKVRSVSNFRSARLKKIFGAKGLMFFERGAQKILAPVRFAPSIYYRLRKPED